MSEGKLRYSAKNLYVPKSFQNDTRTLIKKQYAVGGPFDKWLKTVKTCVSRLSCCLSEGYGNIIQRDFPTKSFTSAVINKNFKNPSGDQLTCELAAAQTQKELDAGNKNFWRLIIKIRMIKYVLCEH